MNKTGLIAKINIKYVLPTCIWKYFWRISRYFAFFGEFRGISRKYLNFAGPRPREISEALQCIKGFAYRFSHNSYLDIDREGLTVYCSSSSGDSVDFGTICTMYQCDCLVTGAS